MTTLMTHFDDNSRQDVNFSASSSDLSINAWQKAIFEHFWDPLTVILQNFLIDTERETFHAETIMEFHNGPVGRLLHKTRGIVTSLTLTDRIPEHFKGQRAATKSTICCNVGRSTLVLKYLRCRCTLVSKYLRWPFYLRIGRFVRNK